MFVYIVAYLEDESDKLEPLAVYDNEKLANKHAYELSCEFHDGREYIVVRYAFNITNSIVTYSSLWED